MRRQFLSGLAIATMVVAGGLVTAPSAHSHPVLDAIQPTPKMIAAAAYSRMSEAQRVGQLFMAGVPSTGASHAELSLLDDRHIGNVILVNSTSEGRAKARRVTKAIRSHTHVDGVKAFISTDQEGGEVQRFTGAGFARMPSALQQGALTTAELASASAMWGHDLAAVGVNLNLAPVADTVPAKHAKRNQPIGRFDREFGHTPAVVSPHVAAFVTGMSAAGVATAVKHFPGLGRATGNTDTSPHVSDPTTRHDAYLAPYAAGIKAGTQFVMVSSATYPAIDVGHLACFSKIVIAGMLRGDLHFGGVVISDDLNTSSLDRFPKGQRAVNFFSAGGTMLLDTSAAAITPMITAVTVKAQRSPAFARQIKAAVMTDLVVKAAAGLILP